jgi:hypothetical protein
MLEDINIENVAVQVYMEELEDAASVFHFYKSMETHLEDCFGPVEDFFRNSTITVISYTILGNIPAKIC